MKIRNFIHKGLKRLYTTGNVKSVPPESMDKLRKMLAFFLDDMADGCDLRKQPITRNLK